MLKKITTIVLLTVILCSIFAGCQSGATPSDSSSEQSAATSIAESKKMVIGFDMLFRRDSWWQDMEKYAKLTAEARGFELLIQDADLDGEKQSQHIEFFTSKGVDAILLAPVDNEAPLAAIAEAGKAGIPVFTVDTGVTDTTYVTSEFRNDHEEAGYKLGVMAGEFLNETNGGQGKVAIILDPTLVTAHVRRVDGFKRGLKETCPASVIVAEQDGKCDREKSMEITESILTANPDTTVFYGVNQDMELGIIAALASKNLDPEKYGVFGEGWDADCYREFKSSKPYLKGVMVPEARSLIEGVVNIICDYLEGKAVDKQTIIPHIMVNTDNATEYFEGRLGITLD